MGDSGNHGNAGVSVDFQPDLAASAAAAAAELGSVMASVDANQAAAARFIAENGAEVLDGHSQVSGPGGGVPVTQFD